MDKEGLEDKQDNQMEENNNDKDKDKTRWTLDTNDKMLWTMRS